MSDLKEYRSRVAEAIWNASRADEGTISATGANHVADALLGGVVADIVAAAAPVLAVQVEKQGKHIAELQAYIDRMPYPSDVDDAYSAGAADVRKRVEVAMGNLGPGEHLSADAYRALRAALEGDR